MKIKRIYKFMANNSYMMWSFCCAILAFVVDSFDIQVISIFFAQFLFIMHLIAKNREQINANYFETHKTIIADKKDVLKLIKGLKSNIESIAWDVDYAKDAVDHMKIEKNKGRK